MNRGDKKTVWAVTLGCVLLVTLGTVSATGAAVPTSYDRPVSTGVSADSVAETTADQTDTQMFAADAQTDEDCVVDSFGSVYPELVEVRCTESESGEPSLAIGGTGGWAYLMYLEIPPASSSTGILGRGGEVITKASGDDFAGPFTQRWTDALSPFDDEVVIIKESSFAVGGTADNPILFAHAPGSIFQSIPPGVYEIRVVVYKKTRATNTNSDFVAQAIRNAPRQESELTVELGPCRADYNAEQRLENVDENILERYEELGEAKAKYSEARRSFGDNVRSLTDSVLSGGTKAALKKGAKLKDILTGAVGPGDLNTVASIQDDLEKGTQAQKSFDRRVSDIKQLQSKKSSIFEGVERCNGEPYSLEEYRAPSPSEIQDAVKSGGDDQ